MVLKCHCCDKVIEVGTVCPICGVATYCSPECLNNDIDKHKEVCGNLTVTDGACYFCGKHGIKLKKCGACKITRYCNRECQKADWPDHKKRCFKDLPEGITTCVKKLTKLNFGVIISMVVGYIVKFPKLYNIKNKTVALFKILDGNFFDNYLRIPKSNEGIPLGAEININFNHIIVLPLTLDEFKKLENPSGFPVDYEPNKQYLICAKYGNGKLMTSLTFDRIEDLIRTERYFSF